VKVLAGGGRLWVLVDVPEDPGFSSGVKWMVAPEGAKSVAEAAALSFGPQEVRAPRYVARGPRGVGRATYRFQGAADLSLEDRWTAETAIPFEDLALPSDTTPLRLTVAVTLRTPNRIAGAPVGALFEKLDAFARLLPPEGGWTAGAGAAVQAESLAAEDDADRRRIEAWSRFVGAQRTGAVTRAKARDLLLAPLDAASAARPDLALLHVIRGNILRQLEDEAGARAAYGEALRRVPHLREAEWGLAQMDAAAWTQPSDALPSDYEAAFARIAEEAKRRGPGDRAPCLAEGILRYRHGDFGRAKELLFPLVAAYPVDDDTAAMPAFAKKYEERWSEELGYRRRDESRADLPRARIVTSKGPLLVELFEDDAPNSVRNFVWLAKAGFYDGTTFHRVVPFFMAQGGDPLSKSGDPRVGQGGPGYAVPTEPGRRLPFRGVLAFANSGKDTEGSQFFVTTGTSAHLEGDFSVFGRVLQGQDVADRLVRGDRIERVEILRTREHEYRPTTVAGTPAPAPK
jgi:peptidyl-prolyl cis-trans isomerase B (cyclophilin B)